MAGPHVGNERIDAHDVVTLHNMQLANLHASDFLRRASLRSETFLSPLPAGGRARRVLLIWENAYLARTRHDGLRAVRDRIGRSWAFTRSLCILDNSMKYAERPDPE